LHPDIGYAVLVAGQGDLKFWKIPIPWEYGTQWITNRNVNRAYQVLRSLGFDDERILYLNNDLLQDADGDGDADVDWAPSNNGFKLAMGWARLRVGEHSPFILYLTGHGERGEFYLGSGMSDSLFVSNLNQELDKFPEKTQMLIIVDSCYSGSFITAPETISAPNRVIVTSSHDDQKVPAFLNYLFWSPEFWQCVQQGMDIRQAFIKGTKAANDALTRALLVGLISPQPADFCQPWLDDNGDSVGHPPESLGDDGNLAATMKIGVPGGPPSVGEDASNPQLFKDCYDKNGGASKLGYPVGKVHRWKKGYIQDFRGGDGYEGAIMQPDGVNYAYAVYGSIWSKYLILGGAEGVLGYPLTDELSGPVSSITGAKCRYNKFYGSAIVHHATRPKAGLTVFLGHGIFNKWEELNYGESALGLPTSNEREAPQSGADSFDTTGVVCDFEGGHLYWHRVGKYKDKAFETHGAIDGVYQQEGGPGNWLGFLISDEHKDSKTGYARSDFEGGHITTPNGIDYHAYPYTPTPSPSPTTSPTPTLTPPNVHDIAVEHSEIPVLTWPLKGEIEDRRILLEFGDIWTWTYCGGLPKKHTGVDLKASVGEDVYAAYDGVVKAVYALSSKHNWGKGVVIEHSGFTTTYMHVNPVVNEGAHVNKGQKISTLINIDGDEHLHFGVRNSAYSDVSKRGALPQKHGNSDYQDGRFTGCKSAPLFPEKFVDPMKLK
jgi:murein DD-endopeptidase MepM/ murein hydrolase activator NlpD